MYITSFWILQVFSSALGITCNEIISKGSGAAFSPEDLFSLSDMRTVDLKECFEMLGSEPLTLTQASSLWMAILKVFEFDGELSQESLKQLGWIKLGIPAHHFTNMSFVDMDTIETFGRFKNFSASQILSLKNTIMEQWNCKKPEDFTNFDLAVLGQILCAFNSSFIQSFHPAAYRDAASEIATLRNCPKGVMKELANLAMSPEAFGDPKMWSSSELSSIGCVLSGLSSVTLREIPPEAFEGFNAEIIRCLPVSTLKFMTPEQITQLLPDAIEALTSHQINSLSKPQKYALEVALSDNTKSTAYKLSSKVVWILVFITQGIIRI